MWGTFAVWLFAKLFARLKRSFRNVSTQQAATGLVYAFIEVELPPPSGRLAERRGVNNGVAIFNV